MARRSRLGLDVRISERQIMIQSFRTSRDVSRRIFLRQAVITAAAGVAGLLGACTVSAPPREYRRPSSHDSAGLNARTGGKLGCPRDAGGQLDAGRGWHADLRCGHRPRLARSAEPAHHASRDGRSANLRWSRRLQSHAQNCSGHCRKMGHVAGRPHIHLPPTTAAVLTTPS